MLRCLLYLSGLPHTAAGSKMKFPSVHRQDSMTPFILETSRLIIRAFQLDDLRAIHRILDLTFGDGSKIADEAALAERREWLELIDFAFRQLRVKHLIATAEHDNAASIGVRRKLGTAIAQNPFPEPPWLQVVGILPNQPREQRA